MSASGGLFFEAVLFLRRRILKSPICQWEVSNGCQWSLSWVARGLESPVQNANPTASEKRPPDLDFGKPHVYSLALCSLLCLTSLFLQTPFSCRVGEELGLLCGGCGRRNLDLFKQTVTWSPSFKNMTPLVFLLHEPAALHRQQVSATGTWWVSSLLICCPSSKCLSTFLFPLNFLPYSLDLGGFTAVLFLYFHLKGIWGGNREKHLCLTQ